MKGTIDVRIMPNLHESKSYKRLLFSVVLLLLCITILFSLLIYGNFIKKQKDRITLQAQESIERIERWMTAHYQEMAHIVLEIDKNGVFSYAPITAKSQRDELQEELLRYANGDRFWKDISYESLLDKETVYSSQGIFERDSFEKYIYGIRDEFNEEEYQERRKNRLFTTISAEYLIARHYPQEAMAYVFGLPLMSSNPQRLITFYVEKNTVDDIVEQFLPCDVIDVRFYENGSLVYALKGGIANERALVITCTGSVGQYRYDLIADSAVLYADYLAMQYFFICIIGIMCITILGASLVVAKYNYRPLHQLMRKYIDVRNPEMDEYALLDKLVEDVLKQKRTVQEKLFISNLVWGQYENMETLDMDAYECGVMFEYPEFTSCALEYTNSDEVEQISAQICDAFDTSQAMAICAKRDGSKRLTVIINHTKDFENSGIVERVFKTLPHTRVGVGTKVEGPLQICESYQHARQALHDARNRELSFVKYSQQTAAEDVLKCEQEVYQKGQADDNELLLNKTLECIQSHLSDTGMSLDFIANTCGVSTSHLIKCFKRSMSTTPMQYVDSLRMDIARNLLITTNMSLREIIEQCGYLDESNFVRKFKRIEGITPMNYRKEKAGEKE